MPSAKIKSSFQAKDYVPTSTDVRKLIASYFDAKFDSKNQVHIENYFRKFAEMGAIDALHEYRKHNGTPPPSLIDNYPLYPVIFDGQTPKKGIYVFKFFLYLAYLFLMALKAIFISSVSPTSPIKADCLYLRKKDFD